MLSNAPQVGLYELRVGGTLAGYGVDVDALVDEGRRRADRRVAMLGVPVRVVVSLVVSVDGSTVTELRASDERRPLGGWQPLRKPSHTKDDVERTHG